MFDYEPSMVAQFPAPNRHDSRMMVIHRKTGKIEHKIFSDIQSYFSDGDVFVFNNTKVFPARLYGKKEKTGSFIEVFLLRELNHDARLWDVLVDPARKIRVGNKLYFEDSKGNDVLVAEVVDNTTSRGRTIRFLYDGTDEEFQRDLHFLGHTPLPKYVTREEVPEDRERFQTIYAKEIGAVAAPTSGLHFSRELMKRLELRGCEFAELTLHIGLGTFRPIDVEDLSKHKMEAEYFRIDKPCTETVNKARLNGKKVISVGSTTVRAMEAAVTAHQMIKPIEGWTNKFIFPPHDFLTADALVTNFHQPKSSLLILACAFGGYELIMEAYHTAMKEGYRLFSYGDAMLIVD
jgi:S-adenosylmethionine:tRNA ribosyltransferase-isomerase